MKGSRGGGGGRGEGKQGRGVGERGGEVRDGEWWRGVLGCPACEQLH